MRCVVFSFWRKVGCVSPAVSPQAVIDRRKSVVSLRIMIKSSKIWLSLLLLLLLLWLGVVSVESSRSKKKANKRTTKLLGELFVKIQEDDAIAVADVLKENPELLNSKGGGGQTPLMASVLMGATKCVEYLLSLGADTSIPEKDGYTPMHGAAIQEIGRAHV